MPQSPELAGGEGFTFEGDAVAFYLAALLAEAYAPGIDDRIVVRVSVQQRDIGEPLDDVIIDFEDAVKTPARLSLQVKRSLTISDAETNTDFRDIIRDSWATLKKPNFRINADRYGAAVGSISSNKERTLKTLCDWARESLTAAHFDARFADGGSASAEMKEVKADIIALLEKTKETPCTSEEAHQFLAHFVLIQFDFLREGAIDPPAAINHIRDCVTPDDAAKAPLVWSRIVQLARASAGKSGQFDRARLVRLIAPLVRLRGATSFRLDLDKLTELAKSYAKLIPDDVGGTRLDRTSLLENLDTKLTTARVVQVRGLPGSGKSVVVKLAVQRALERGPVLFLKAEQLEGASWISYATSQGLSGAPLEQFLVEIGAVGTSILFIDAIDRVEKEHQPVILDVIHTIIQSPLLDNWRVVVSLRDTGIEMLRNWLGECLDVLKVETLSVDQLSDEEAETLAKAKPHLRPLLFGSPQVKEIVRRPFFAKVLNQSYLVAPSVPTFAPQSEVDLIRNWWQRGGYNETGQRAIERQLTLLDLAHIRARQLSQPIRLSELKSVAHIEGLRSDGILQNAREGISVRFAHDIFFEWSFFHVLADRGPQWLEEIKACGEPPALARVVELASQWEFTQGNNWRTHLDKVASSGLRSQWLRAWLVGPLGTAGFETDEDQFAMAIFANDCWLFRKALVWFQAEKTSPNTNILASALPQEQRQRIADLFGWPSDIAAWCRLIAFILQRISHIPQRLYPEIVAIFDVWQNAFADRRNPMSHALLQQCATWLDDIGAIRRSHPQDETSAYWEKVPDLETFQHSLVRLLLRSSKSEQTFAAKYLERITRSKRLRDETFKEIIDFSPILVQSLPQSIVDLSLVFLRRELPDERVARQTQEDQEIANRRKAIMSMPKAERMSEENHLLLTQPLLRSIGDFSDHDWEMLSTQDDYRSFWPPSPLREPFHSLFQSSSKDALRLLLELCNHAMTAWQQLHRYSRERGGTPIPLELQFPWGTQRFWGTDREYLWFRSTWAPKVIGCGFMALEEWCFAELGRGRPVDELIQQIVEGNECIAILGTAAMLALHTENVSEVTLPIVTSQRLLAADYNRWAQDFSQTASLSGFKYCTDKSHIEAIQAADARPVHKTELSRLVQKFIFATGPIGDRAREAIQNFKKDLPFQFEEHRNIAEVRDHLTSQALEYAELADLKTYRTYRIKDDTDQIAIVHVSPSASKTENVAKAEEASRRLGDTGLWAWASKSFKEKTLGTTYTIDAAIALAKGADANELFKHPSDGIDEDLLVMRRATVAATAAVLLNFRMGLTQEDLEWSRNVLRRAISLPDKPDLMLSPEMVIPLHHGIFVARGLGAEFREGTAMRGAVRDFLGLVAHQLEVVSSAAIEEACKFWSKDPKLTWATLILAFSLCHVPRRDRDQLRQHCEPLHSSSDVQAAIDAALEFYKSGSGWPSLPLPPPAWVKVEPQRDWRGHRGYEDYDEEDVADPVEFWIEPDIVWYSKRAAEILKSIPFDDVLGSDAKSVLLDFLADALVWTNQKNAPPWVKPGRRNRPMAQLFEWTHTLGSTFGQVAGLLQLSEFKTRFLDPILALEGDSCWTLLSPFTGTYVCEYLYYAPVVPSDAITTLDLCVGRFLQDSTFKRDSYRSGEFSDLHQPEIARTLMFVSVEHADLAARYVNGDWSEIGRILPLVNRFVRAGGWAASVMDPYLTLCERAKANYPAESFADQVLAIIGDGPDKLKGWRGTFIPARIAELVQHFAHRDAPMRLALAQKLLRILDMLVDMGDRRSAALQQNEAFREVHL